MMTDPIADMLTRVRNALAVRKQEVILPYSKIKHEVAKVLVKENYLEAAEKVEDTFAKLKLVLKYKEDNQPAISHLRRISKPGRRIYVAREDIPYILNDLGLAIMSTSKGVMTNKQARRGRIGGEIICEVW
ncbi:MAG: 30S ribosomal protein S8 [Candidatus Komeilibacteria bacterium CG10_big_fil_rev_8_21_14_0_10_41_13]|uniref:Small ribosomal subunit protein uS8 n=1 Tax=Candidatus Komeilibacteria bacterium CG10_big_fil_rev_8_21_14_0_10_41_13 TaxID=1974476 RepID=A0A2M6WDB4_9BACT|nr:MAG: 30S ribosomal protein S8 [Candidatus Komeilibacteria bacterium CG10_big_fil_rev_8_21_14_0_10_41_13]